MTPIPADQLHAHWPWVRKGLEEVRKKCREEWLPEDVYLALKTGNAFLVTLDNDGFLVLQKHHGFRGPILFVWVVWGPHRLQQRQQEIEDGLDDIARGMGAAAIRHHSPFKAWARQGYTEMNRIYQRAV